jgi:hypothetical protein
MERYKAFARQTELPLISVTSNTLIEVGGTVKTEVARMAQLSIRKKEALAGQFGVPVGVIEKLAPCVTNSSSPGADQLVQELRTAVIDYRFLQIEWDRYHAPVEGQQAKSNALAALQAGDLDRAWELYDALRKPLPPANLRIVAQP